MVKVTSNGLDVVLSDTKRSKDIAMSLSEKELLFGILKSIHSLKGSLNKGTSKLDTGFQPRDVTWSSKTNPVLLRAIKNTEKGSKQESYIRLDNEDMLLVGHRNQECWCGYNSNDELIMRARRYLDISGHIKTEYSDITNPSYIGGTTLNDVNYWIKKGKWTQDPSFSLE